MAVDLTAGLLFVPLHVLLSHALLLTSNYEKELPCCASICHALLVALIFPRKSNSYLVFLFRNICYFTQEPDLLVLDLIFKVNHIKCYSYCECLPGSQPPTYNLMFIRYRREQQKCEITHM